MPDTLERSSNAFTRGQGFTILMSVLLIALLCVGFVGFLQFREQLLADQVEAVEQRTERLRVLVDEWLLLRKTEIAALGNTPTIRSMDWEKSGPFLKEKHKAWPWFYIFAHINPDGSYYNSKVDFAKGRNLSDRAHFKASIGGRVYASDPVVSRTLGTDIVAVTSPIYDRDGDGASIIGVFGGMIDTQTIKSQLAAFEYGPDSYAFALNSTGIAISHPDPDRMGNINTKAESFLDDGDQELVRIAKLMTNRTSGSVISNLEGHDHQVLVTYMPLEQADWSIATAVSYDHLKWNIAYINYVGALGAVSLLTIFWVIMRARAIDRKALATEKKLSDEKNKAKSMFLAHMSHELRTPLNGIIGYAQLLIQRYPAGRTESEFANTILNSGNHLLQLINRILDLSKIEAGKLTVSVRPANIHMLAVEIEKIFQIEKERRNNTLTVFIDTDIPDTVAVDIEKLRQILINLVANSLKFTDNGQVELRIEAVGTQSYDALPPNLQCSFDCKSNAVNMRVTVKDNGIGMSEDALHRATRPFEQVADNPSIYGGTGLGLSIVSELVKLLNGSIDITSAVGKGTCITIQFAAAVPDASLQTGTDISRTYNALKETSKKAVLIVDDNPLNQRFLLDTLEPLGFNTVSARDGLEALALLKEGEGIDLIITDLVMPNMDGFELIANVRALENRSDLPIIVSSASAFDSDQIRSIALGANQFLSKPVDVNLLLSAMTKFLHLQWEDAEIEEEEQFNESIQTDVPPAPDGNIVSVCIDAAEKGAYIEIERYLSETDNMYSVWLEKQLRPHLRMYDGPSILKLLHAEQERML